MMLVLALLSCAPNYDDVDVKTVGVGYNPEEIGPSPTPLGGVVEYSWVNFAGGGLSLAMMSLGSFDEVGPAMVGYAPPYAAVYGFSYLFTEKLEAADSLGGVTSVPPEAEDTCYTTFEATGPIGSFKTIDVGQWMELVTEDGTGGLRMDRYPQQYPADNQDAFAYYSGIDIWTLQPQYGLVPGADGSVANMSRQVIHPASYPAGQEVIFRFPGGMAPVNAPLGSVPVSSNSVGETKIKLPNLPGGVQLEWSGPRYDGYGNVLETGGDEQRTCLAYAGHRVGAPSATDVPEGQALVGSPQSAAECADALYQNPNQEDPANLGQMYTGPWDTDDGSVLFRWEPDENRTDEYVHLAVRFLGPVDEADPNYLEEVVYESAPTAVQADWKSAQRDNLISSEAEVPDGRRAPTACEDEGSYEFDDAYLDENGGYVPSMRGDPFHNMAEVTCRMKDDGEFALTSQMIEEALAYARAHGAQGAVFYFGRSTETQVEVPAAMDNYGNRKEITPIGVATRAVDIGRFWFEE